MRKTDRIIASVFIALLILVILVLYSGIKWHGDSGKDSSGDRVAVIELKGIIINSHRICELLRKYGRREDIDGIVLRIDSPGGGVAASQEIYAAVKSNRTRGMPIVASIGTVGASGGYYAALGAHKILANPGSITGSIGVVVNFPVAYELFEKLGIDLETVKSGAYKDLGSPYREMTPDEEKQLQTVVAELYEQFLATIQIERGLSRKDLLKIADGRILAGSQALEYGLIDSLGTFDDAIELVAEMAGIDTEPELVYPKGNKTTLIDLLLSDYENVVSLITPFPALNYQWR